MMPFLNVERDGSHPGIKSNCNEVTGWLGVWWEGRDEAMPAAEAAEAYRRFLRESGAPAGIVGEKSSAVASTLAEMPGFKVVGETWEYARPWPSGIVGPDRVGVRVATPADAEAIARVLNEALQLAEGWFNTAAELRDELFKSGRYNILLGDGEGDIGFGSASHDGRNGIVNWVCVVPRAQGRGLGKRIFEVLLAELDTVPHERLTLEVEADNASAIRLYEHYGFRRASRTETRLKYTAQ